MRSMASRYVMVFLCMVFASSMSGCAGDAIRKLVVTDISPTSVKDGTYEGEQHSGLVSARVEVVVKNGAVTEIKVLDHRHGPGHGAEAIVDRVIAAQSLNVDAVSGATSSSKVMLKAIETALQKGL